MGEDPGRTALLRLSMGRGTLATDVDDAIDHLVEAIDTATASAGKPPKRRALTAAGG
jgi:cysteine sulfinate desulfinase/cysteine desulfurase-like protein